MEYEYEVALSFAGEDRRFAEAVANDLHSAGVKVFYDDFYAEELWGEDLSVKLRTVYHSSSQYCIMIISEHYVRKMWPSHERQQAIERMINERGKMYILPVRLNGFDGEVPGLSKTISYLAVSSNHPEIIVDAFLRKIGRVREAAPRYKISKTEEFLVHVPKLKKQFTDREKNQFLKSAFEEIIRRIKDLVSATQKEYPHFDYEMEMVTSRKAFFTLYENERQICQFQIWIGGILGGNSIAFFQGQDIDVSNDGSMNESISLAEHEGELKLRPLGMGSFGAERDRAFSPQETADYLWKIVCRHFS